MRISDGSSDVCSSDLAQFDGKLSRPVLGDGHLLKVLGLRTDRCRGHPGRCPEFVMRRRLHVTCHQPGWQISSNWVTPSTVSRSATMSMLSRARGAETFNVAFSRYFCRI